MLGTTYISMKMKINQKSLITAVKEFEAMTLKQKESIVDEIFVQQPNLLGSVLVQSHLGNRMEQIDVLLKILIVLHIALKAAKVKIELISEDLQDRELNRLVANIKFTEGLSQSLSSKSLKNYVDHHKEKHALAFAFNELVISGIAHAEEECTKYLMLAGLNIVSCISEAKIA